ncbi:MAG: WbqC family protein [Saprospiraceae bacterium]
MKKKLLIELPYLGTVGYFAKLLQYEEIIIEQHENYRKRTYRNRCHLMSANGILKLSIPLGKGKNQGQNITEVKITYSQPWQVSHWRSIKSAYGRAPYYEYYADEIKAIYDSQPATLFELNKQLMELMIELLQLDLKISYSESFQKALPENTEDGRNMILPNKDFEDENIILSKYNQVFEDKHGFIPNLSILDLLFCCGPEAQGVLMTE